MSDQDHIKDYEDVTVYPLDPDMERQLIEQQNECSFTWVTKDGSPMSVIMSYLERDGRFWMTASGHRKRIPAIRRDPRVAIVITSTGTKLGAGKTVSYKGTAFVHDDDETKAWFYPALAERLMGRYGEDRVKEFAMMLDSPRRVIVEIVPGLRVGYDGAKMRAATEASREAGILKLD
jgi:hypothetical protein